MKEPISSGLIAGAGVVTASGVSLAVTAGRPRARRPESGMRRGRPPAGAGLFEAGPEHRAARQRQSPRASQNSQYNQRSRNNDRTPEGFFEPFVAGDHYTKRLQPREASFIAIGAEN